MPITSDAPHYAQAEQRFRRIGLIGEAAALLNWDQAVMCPDGSMAARGEQMAELSLTAHERLTDPALGELLELATAEEAPWLESWRAANLAEMVRMRARALALPPDLVERLAKIELDCENHWREKRAANDWAGMVPLMTELLRLKRQSAQLLGEALGLSPMDALIDGFEPGARAAGIDALFADLSGWLPQAAAAIIDAQAARPQPLIPEGPFPIDRQRALGESLMRTVGFDFASGRLDVSHHPFSGGTPDDRRITTRYDEADFTRALMGVLHETGHAMYDAGLPAAWRRQPVGEARGMALHESQSLLVEMQACRSQAFLRHLAPAARAAFGADGPAWTADNLHALAIQVRRGLIRVDADEVTYPLHVMLRWRLERALLADDLALADLPGAWNDGMAELVGVRPNDDRDGCLQDVHWFCGAFGYFPLYTLGALAAAQLFEAADAALNSAGGGVETDLAAGDFSRLMGWLRTHVHGRASSADTETIMRDATGASVGTAAFRRHLTRRYGVAV